MTEAQNESAMDGAADLADLTVEWQVVTTKRTTVRVAADATPTEKLEKSAAVAKEWAMYYLPADSAVVAGSLRWQAADGTFGGVL